MDESRIPNVAFEYNPKKEEKWDVHKRDGCCEVRTDPRPKPWREEDYDDDDVENVEIHILYSVNFFFTKIVLLVR